MCAGRNRASPLSRPIAYGCSSHLFRFKEMFKIKLTSTAAAVKAMGQSKVDYLRKVSLRAERSMSCLGGMSPSWSTTVGESVPHWQSFDQQSNAQIAYAHRETPNVCRAAPNCTFWTKLRPWARANLDSLPVEGACIFYTTSTKSATGSPTATLLRLNPHLWGSGGRFVHCSGTNSGPYGALLSTPL